MSRRQPEKPEGDIAAAGWGSDAIAQMLRRLDVGYIALNPGSSFRGLHDSLVNHLGNADPQMLLCLHEEHAIAIAHGWAKVTGKPMAVFLHANVGLMHASMAIYNAWCDRVPMLIFGATGPVDADKRRPWIDWIHTSRDQAALVRPFVKWDDQPASLEASLASMMRADMITRTVPEAPVYVCFDVSVQEATIIDQPKLPNPVRFQRPSPPAIPPEALEKLCVMLREAKSPVILMGRVGRNPLDWAYRLAMAENLKARVLTDIKTGAAFPTCHPLHTGGPGFFLSPEGAVAVSSADLILCLDWVDPAGTLKQAQVSEGAKVIQISMDHQLSNGWSLDHQALAHADIHIAATADLAVREICRSLGIKTPEPVAEKSVRNSKAQPQGKMDTSALAAALEHGLEGERVTLVRLPLGWSGEDWRFQHPLDYLGYDGGAGIGSGPGMTIGAALALQDTGRIPVAVLGDGDVMMGASALWTAARYGVPLLIVVANNQSFFNDEVHQERVAKDRNRPVENRWIGQRIAGPDIDIAGIARAQGLVGIGPVTEATELITSLREAVKSVKAGHSVVIDARIQPGYAKSMAAGMTDSAE